LRQRSQHAFAQAKEGVLAAVAKLDEQVEPTRNRPEGFAPG